jgi:outer membrane receptor protein involved in Fe transport
MQKSSNVLVAGFISGLTLVGAAIHSPAAFAQDVADKALEEIVVTATKRDATVAEIPMSVTVLGGATMDRQRILSFEDMMPLVPGLSLAGSSAGVNRITLRGLNTSGVASTVGVYLDEVPFGSSTALANGAILSGDFDTFDMARIEVLRGPQGTLYGASSLGGVMKYVPNRPDTEATDVSLRGAVESVDNGDLGYHLSAAVNIPVTDKFAVRATGFYRKNDGYIDSLGNNPILLPSTEPYENFTRVADDINEIESSGGRVQALYQFSDDVSLNLMAMAQDINNSENSTVDADPATLEPLYGTLARSSYHPSIDDLEYRLYSATLDWDFGGMSLLSVTSYSTLLHDIQDDLDPLLAQTFTAVLPLFGLTNGEPVGGLLFQNTGTDKFTQEFRLVSADSDTFEWMAGIYYTDEDSYIDPQRYVAVDAGTENEIVLPVVLGQAGITSNYEELAVFGNATWHLTSRFELSVGARSSSNDQVATQFLDGLLLGLAEPDITNGSSSESPFTWSVAPRFAIDDNTSIYARAATGFRPGGPNIIPPTAPPDTPTAYDSDSLTSYELGVKTSGDTFSLDVAVFFEDWEDIQLLTTFGEGSNAVNINANGGTAESKGVEFSAGFAPVEGLALFVNGAYTDAALTQDAPSAGGFDGDPLPWVPEWSVSVGGDYDWSLSSGSTAYVGGTVAYTGDRPTGYANRDPVDNSIIDMASYTLVSLRAGIEYERWTVEFYGSNLANEYGSHSLDTNSLLPNGAVTLGLIRPRTFGVSASVKF